MNAPSTPSPRSRRRSWRFHAAWVLALAALVGGGVAAWQKFFHAKNARDLYQIATVQRGDIQDLVTATGTVQPRDYVDVGAQVSGQLKKLHVEVGSVVQSGDLLAEIDPTVLTATVDARRAGLRNQRAALKANESQLALATLQHKRQKNLAAADATTQEALQIAEAAVRSAQAQIEAVKAQIEQTESTLRADEATLNYARIYSPMSGTVVSITARQGQTLNTNQAAPTLLRVADLSTMTVQTQVSEAEIGKLRMGMEVYFTTLGSQGRRWYGSLRKVEPTPTVTNNVVLYNALFDVPNTNQALMPSMTTQVFFVAASAENVLTVPAAALVMARAPGGHRRERGTADAGRDKAASEPGAASTSTSASASASRGAASAPRAAAPVRRAASAAAGPVAVAGGASAAPASEAAGRDRFASMSPEERRAAFEAMPPEERQALRERRRAQREAQDGNGGVSAPAAAALSIAAASAAPGGERRRTRDAGAATASAAPAAPAASGPVSRGSTAGFSNQATAPRTLRKATVKVIDAQGRIEERPVELGVTTRVQAQVLSGLNEGDQVIVGIKQPPSANARGNNNNNSNSGGNTGNPNALGGMPGAGNGMPGAGGGRGR